MREQAPPELTKREREVCALVALDMTYDQVAEVLEISSGTVRKVVENIGRKLPGDFRARTKILHHEYSESSVSPDTR